MKTALSGFFGLFLAACSSPATSEGASAEGTFAVVDAVATEQVDVDTMQVTLSSIGGVCGLMQTGNPAPERDYDVVTFTFGTIQPGTYDLIHDEGLAPPGKAQAVYLGNRACTSKYGAFASGTVTITSVGNGHVTGTYDMHFADGWPYGTGFKGSTQGTFDAAVCDTQGHLPAIACQ